MRHGIERNTINTDIAGIQGYHAGGERRTSESYAFEGFPKGLWWLNSDRALPLTENFERTDGQSLKCVGLEIETECNTIQNYSVLSEVFDKIIFPKFKFGDRMFKKQEDGSLGGSTSVEVITLPMTFERIRNDYAAWKAMFDYMYEFGIEADSFHTQCGMHVNLSNGLFGNTEEKRKENIMKLYYVINKHYDLMLTMFHRPASRTNWCQRMTEDFLRRVFYTSPSRAHKWRYENARNITDFSDASSSHNCCMNLSHYGAGRIEIRLVGGQKDFYCFRNTMETVFFLVTKVQRMAWEDLDDVVKLFSGCNQYVVKRLRDAVVEYRISAQQYDRINDAHKDVDFELRSNRR